MSRLGKEIPQGTRVGRLIVGENVGLRPVGGGRTRTHYRCVCDCGEIVVRSGNALKNAGVRSCGCLQRDRRREANLKHGYAHKHPLYTVWKAMRQRCTNPRDKEYPRYGARGIYVCDRWQEFDVFLADMGERPDHHYSIDRIDNDGPYAPENCRWATPIEQRRNQRIYASGRCKHGHEYTAENTYYSAKGSRVCRTCVAAYQRAYVARKRVAA